jgi:hypothetical protein
MPVTQKLARSFQRCGARSCTHASHCQLVHCSRGVLDERLEAALHQALRAQL